jgi:hypothetical protein
MSTLKEKFKDITEVRNHNHFDILVNKLEQIADDYAIEFAEWMAKEYWLNSSGKYMQSQTHKELLEIFKKEKGL